MGSRRDSLERDEMNMQKIEDKMNAFKIKIMGVD
jgi:hypothetical protein